MLFFYYERNIYWNPYIENQCNKNFDSDYFQINNCGFNEIKELSDLITLAIRINQELKEYFNLFDSDFHSNLYNLDNHIVETGLSVYDSDTNEVFKRSKRSNFLEYFGTVLLVVLIWIFFLFLFLK